ncbi:MAG TPA: hypothetical protein VND93_01535 [Myxococcales bacterium]|nr:hypothetical protein [Myxococcales bacterium]
MGELVSDLSALGEYQAPSSAGRLLGAAGCVLTLVLAAGLERLQFKLRATESAHWWTSNGRDAINAFALLAMAGGLFAMGFSAPMAFFLGAVLMLELSLVQTALERHRHAGMLSVGAALLFGSPVLLFPASIHGGCRRLLEALF